MKILFLIFIFSFSVFSADFSNKKIIKLQEDNLNIIDLNQQVKSKALNQQKELFDSSTLIEKKAALKKDKELDFALLMGHKKYFAYNFENVSVNANKFSEVFTRIFVKSLNLPLANSGANGLFQTSKNLQIFAPNTRLINTNKFLKEEKNKDKIYARFSDYLLTFSLNDFYINTTNFLVFKRIEAICEINFKVVSVSSGKILKAKNATLSLALSEKNSGEENLNEVLSQMPVMLANLVKKETKNLRVED